MKYWSIGALGMALACSAGTSLAQPVGIGVTKGSAVNQLGTAVAKVVSEHSGIQMRTHPMGGSQQYIDQMDGGQIEFGMVSSMHFSMNYNGTHSAAGKKRSNIRIVASLVPFNSGLLVPNSSGIKTADDLKGKRVSWGFSSAPEMQIYAEGLVASGGYGEKDITPVPASGLPQGLALLKTGKVDAALAAVGAAHVQELEVSIPGGVRFVSLSPAPERVARVVSIIPGSRIELIRPAPNLLGIPEPVHVLAYDYMLGAHKDVPAATVERIVRALAEHVAELKATGPLWRNFEPRVMSRDYGLPYHDAATAYYKASGLWNR